MIPGPPPRTGLLLAVVVTIAGIQDRDAAHRLLTLLRDRFHTVVLVWADGSYAGPDHHGDMIHISMIMPRRLARTNKH